MCNRIRDVLKGLEEVLGLLGSVDATRWTRRACCPRSESRAKEMNAAGSEMK